MTKSAKALKIKTSILFNLVFTNYAVLSWLFFFFLIIDWYFLITAVIIQISNPAIELNSYRNTNQRCKSRYWNASSNCKN